MTKQRRSFSAEFKREAAGLVLDQGYSHIEASRSLGVVESALRRWVNQLQLAIVFFHPVALPLEQNRSKKPGQRFGLFAILKVVGEDAD